jgi:4-amino-4-deoxy-L-arabinose transferase-like glycosyltransferase
VKTAVIAQELEVAGGTRTGYAVLCGVVALLTAGLLAYADTASFTWDEGFHLLAAQLILGGKRPYLDFFHAQTPLYAYWNAAWMWLFGEKWRVAHTLSALLSGGAVMLTADFVYSRFPATWRLAAAITAAVLTAGNAMVVAFGTLGQPYGVCLFFEVAAFRAAIPAIGSDGWMWAGLAGILAGTSAGSSLLSAPVAPVLLIWILWHSPAGDRLRKLMAFVIAGAIPFLPLVWFFAQSRQAVLFDVFKWHLFYRHVNWPGETEQNLSVITAWLDSSHAFLLTLLAGLGLHHLLTVKDGWEKSRRAEFYLSAWIAAGLGIYLASTHPTFTRYFVLMVPFVAIVAAVGLYAFVLRFAPARRPGWFVLVLTILIGIGLARHLHDEWDSYHWSDMEAVAKKVDQVTPAGGSLWADEHIYFITHRVPPSGMEFAYSHKIALAPELARSLHMLSAAEVEAQVAAQKFDTVASCEDDDEIARLGLAHAYRRQEKIGECWVFWDAARR